MNRIRIAVTVPLGAALKTGKSEFGETSVALSDADVAALSAEARECLHDRSRHDNIGVDERRAGYV